MTGTGQQTEVHAMQVSVDPSVEPDTKIEKLLAAYQPRREKLRTEVEKQERVPGVFPGAAETAQSKQATPPAIIIGETLRVGMPLGAAMALLGMPEGMRSEGSGAEVMSWMDYPDQGLGIGAKAGGKTVEVIDVDSSFRGRFVPGFKIGDPYTDIIGNYGMPPSLAQENARYPDKGLVFRFKDQKLFGARISPIARLVREATAPKPAFTPRSASNKGARIEIVGLSFEGKLAVQIAPAGKTFLVLGSRWENAHPKQKTRKDGLDITKGIGGLGFGAGTPQATVVEHDVPYKIKRPLDHVLAEALAQPGSDAIGGEGSKPVSVPEQGAGVAEPAKPVLPALEVAPYDFSSVPAEVEPNDEREQATPLTRDGEQWVARGRLTDRDFDWYVFRVEGEPQRWLVEAVGSNLRRLRYRNAAGETKDGARHQGSGRWTIANLFLTPGSHWLEVWSTKGDADYRLRAIPLGTPSQTAEREPNDDPSRAHLLRFGTPRTGLLLDRDDEDYYQFSLNAAEYVELEVASPHEITPRLTVWEMGLTRTEQRILFFRGHEAGSNLLYRAWLPPGDYIAEVKAQDGYSASPYRLRINRLDPFDLPSDLEPNDEPQGARPIPSSFTVTGTVGDPGDADWYRLPKLLGVTEVSAEILERPVGASWGSFLRLYREGENRHAKVLQWNKERGIYEGTIDAKTPWLARVYGRGDYQVRFAFKPGPAPRPAPGSLPVRLSMPTGPHVFAAYWHQDQQGELPVTLVNEGGHDLHLRLDVLTSHHAWRARPERTELHLAAGERTPVMLALSVARDAWAERPVRIWVRARDQAGAQRTASTDALARCGAPPLGARSASPLPAELLGGLNVAWSALGARPIATDERAAEDQAPLHDGLTPNDDGWYTRKTPATVTVELAGSEPVPVAGFLLNPRGEHATRRQVKRFELALSLDGREFTTVVSDELGRAPREQAFLLDQPQPARFARLQVLSSHEGEGGYAHLGEWKVIAAPGTSFTESEPFNLASPRKGGHIVWSDPLMSSYRRTREILTEDVERPRMRLDPLNANSWVLGFHHQRAAQIRTLEWVQADEKYDVPRLGTVQVSLSTQSPTGPWSPVGTWQLDTRPASTSRFEFPNPTWARYMRFSTTEPTTSANWQLPETLRVLERPENGGYRSVLGEWGQYSQSAYYEQVIGSGRSVDAFKEADDNDDRHMAQALAPGRRQRGHVLVGEDVDWYRVQVPDGHNRLELSLAGDPALRVVGRIEDEAGQEIPLDGIAEVTPGGWRADLAVKGGDVYFVQVEEPPRSIVLAWDNSSSTNPFKPTLYQALPRFVASVQRGREFVNLLPFQSRGGDFLLEEWSDQPQVLQTALNDYDRDDGSSEAELALLTATKGLAERSGTRAVVFLTDADTHSYRETAKLWQLLEQVRPRVFTLELHRGNVAYQQDLMQSWAAVNEGRYDFFRTNADLEVAFDRASCHLRRPAGYFLGAATRFEEPPGPGALSIRAKGPVPGAGANFNIELVLDASGSMRERKRRIDGKLKIDVAKQRLLEIIESLPSTMKVALRAYGHRVREGRSGDCTDTELLVPVGKVDKRRLRLAVNKLTALGTTPLSYSLLKAARDLAAAPGEKLILLVTDGKEECGVDPAIVVQRLVALGVDIRVDVVGFALADEKTKDDMRRVAELTGGRFFDAQDAGAFEKALRDSLAAPFQVLDPEQDIVARGVVNAAPIQLPAGTYSVNVNAGNHPLLIPDVPIAADRMTEIELTRRDGSLAFDIHPAKESVSFDLAIDVPSSGIPVGRETPKAVDPARLIEGLDALEQDLLRQMVDFKGAGERQLSQVKQAQQMLRQLGFDPGAADGIWGRNTEQAVRQFQRWYPQEQLEATGRLDARTLRALQDAVK